MRTWFWWAAGAGASALLVLFLFDPAQHAFYPRCYWRAWTGMNCAGCGSLRATHHLLHGEVALAFRYNPLLVVTAPILAVWCVRWFWRRRRQDHVPPRLPAVLNMRWVWIGGAVLVLYTLLRNIRVPALSWLVPP